jgi:Sigma-70, region 4
MNPVRKFRHFEFRERVTDAILGMLAHLPETHRNIFIWSHYRGYQSGQIAEILGWSSLRVEATLGGINSILYQKARALLAESQFDTETSLAGGVTPQEPECHLLVQAKWITGGR